MGTIFSTTIDLDSFNILEGRLRFTHTLKKQIEDVANNSLRSEKSKNEDIKNIRNKVPGNSPRNLPNKDFCLHAYINGEPTNGTYTLLSHLGNETETINNTPYQKCDVCGRKVDIEIDPKHAEEVLDACVSLIDNAVLLAPISSPKFKLRSTNIKFLIDTRDSIISAKAQMIIPIYEYLYNYQLTAKANGFTAGDSAYPTDDGRNLFSY